MPQNELGDIISKCKDLLSTRTGFGVNHVRQQENKVAHSLARAFVSQPRPNI